jgi:hypothetical protein
MWPRAMTGLHPYRRFADTPLPFTILVLSITFLCRVTVGLQVHKWSACQALAGAMELRAWDIVCEEPLDDGEAQGVRKGKL